MKNNEVLKKKKHCRLEKTNTCNVKKGMHTSTTTKTTNKRRTEKKKYKFVKGEERDTRAAV